MSAAALKEGAQFGQYNLIKRIAVGGMAEIHLARTVSMGAVEKLLALKVINPKHSADQEFIDMLIDEAKISVQLSHVNICQTFDLGRVEDIYYIAMEFIDGKDLYQILVKCADLELPIPFDLIAFIGMELTAGLHYAHTKMDNYGRPLSIIHRDVSPQNVLVSYDGEVKIVDFGIAKASQRSRETENGVIKGKFFYMSPEQAWGDQVDARTDVFSAGICLYEMICGEMLYQEEKALQLLDKVRKAEIPNMRAKRPDLPPELEQIVLKALAQKREDRYGSAAELQAALSGFLYRTYPGFNRTRVSTFMAEIFGNQRFVLPMPGQVDSQGPTTGAARMQAREFSSTSHSVIIDTNDTGAQGRIITSAIAQPQARPFPGSPTNPLAARPAGGVPAQHDFDDDDEEHTIAETFWDQGGTLDPTGALQVDPDLLTGGGPGAPLGGHEETPTRLFNRPDLVDEVLPARPRRTLEPDPPMAATVGLSVPEAEIAALGLGDFDEPVGPTRALPAVDATGEMPPVSPQPARPQPAHHQPTTNIPMATPVPVARPALQPTPTPMPEPGGRVSVSGKPLPPKRNSKGPIPPKRDLPPGRPTGESMPAAKPQPVKAAETPAPQAPKAEKAPAVKAPAAKAPAAKAPAAKAAESKPAKPRNRADEGGRPTISSEGPPSAKASKRKDKAEKKGAAEKSKIPRKGPRRRRKRGLAKLFGPVGITAALLLALTGYVVWQVVAPELITNEVAKSATLVVNSTPPGAEIFFNGRATGQTTPASVPDVETGATHMLILKRDGYEDHQEQVKIRADALTDGKYRFSAFLKRAGGTLVLNTEPPGVQVFVDGRYIGDTPLKKTGLDREKEEFLILLNKEGYVQRREILRWNDETSIELKDLKMEKAP